MKKMGILLIVLGIVMTVAGVYMLSRDNNAEKVVEVGASNNKVVTSASSADSLSSYSQNDRVPSDAISTPVQSDQKEDNPQKDAEDGGDGRASESMDPKAIGNEFENFVANLFVDKSMFKVLEWNQGTTSTEGVYAERDKNPDFRIKQSFNKKGLEYWVECKYRTPDKGGNVTVKQYHLNRYRAIQGATHIKIFVAIGIGGKPGAPREFYVVPLDSIDNEKVSLQEIARFKVGKTGSAFAGYIRSYFTDHVFKKTPK